MPRNAQRSIRAHKRSGGNFDNERFVLDKDDTIITYFYFSANDMLLFLRDADVVDEWLRTQQATNTTSTIDEQVDLETCEKEIHDLEKRQGNVTDFSVKFSSFVKS